MKMIVAGIDFSKSSYNAAAYAAMLAHKLNCKLILFNMYEVPLIHSNEGMYFMLNAPIRKESENKLFNFCKKLQKQFPKVEIHTFISAGFFKDQLTAFMKKHKVELVVMGLSTKSKFSRFIYGSHSTDIAGKIKAPVIIVPDNFKNHHLHNILLGVDNKEKLHRFPLTAFQNFIKQTKSAVSFLHVRTEDEVITDNSKQILKINGKAHKIENCSSPTIEKGITAYTKKKKADLITIISRKHSVFYNLFSETNTKKIAFASKIPVMCIHE
jgi:nucleotide-binding universal stress UspA family protein